MICVQHFFRRRYNRRFHEPYKKPCPANVCRCTRGTILIRPQRALFRSICHLLSAHPVCNCSWRAKAEKIARQQFGRCGTQSVKVVQRSVQQRARSVLAVALVTFANSASSQRASGGRYSPTRGPACSISISASPSFMRAHNVYYTCRHCQKPLDTP